MSRRPPPRRDLDVNRRELQRLAGALFARVYDESKDLDAAAYAVFLAGRQGFASEASVGADEVRAAVARRWGISVDALVSGGIATLEARDEAAWRLRRQRGVTVALAGRAVGLNPRNAARAIRRHEERLAASSELRAAMTWAGGRTA